MNYISITYYKAFSKKQNKTIWTDIKLDYFSYFLYKPEQIFLPGDRLQNKIYVAPIFLKQHLLKTFHSWQDFLKLCIK